MSVLIVPTGYEPKAVFSPSGLSRARRCLHAWGLRYLLGVKRPEWTWEEAQAAPVPVAKVKSRPTEEERLAKKAYNSKYRPALGKECHARAECYYKGGAVDWNDKPGRILLAGMHCLPHPDQCEVVEAEGEITIEVDGVKFRGYRDLLLKKDGAWLLVDFKTTFTFDFFDREKTMRTVKTPAQLMADPQANLYAYAVMQREGLTSIACRWLYLRTEDKPEGLPVDFVITWEGASAIVVELVKLAKELTGFVDDALESAARGVEHPGALVMAFGQLEKNPDACPDFGGCEYHSDRGGPCTPPALSPGDKLVRIRLKAKARAALPPKEPRQPKEKRATMGFRNKPAAAPAPKAADEEQPDVDNAQQDETTDDVDNEKQDGAEATVEAPAPKPAKAPRAAAPKAAAEDVEEPLMVSRGGTLLEVPTKSPFYKPLAKALKAVQDCQKALAGE